MISLREFAVKVKSAGLRKQYPEWSETEITGKGNTPKCNHLTLLKHLLSQKEIPVLTILSLDLKFVRKGIHFLLRILFYSNIR